MIQIEILQYNFLFIQQFKILELIVCYFHSFLLFLIIVLKLYLSLYFIHKFIDYILPKTNSQLKQLSLRRRETFLQGRHAHFHSDQVILRNSEYLASEIIFTEIKGFREIEDLRKQLNAQQNYNMQQIFQVVDYDNKGIIDFEVLSKFMKKNGIQFNEDEFRAFLSRTTEDGDSKLDYEELIIALMPIDPYVYPHYREEFNPLKNNQYVIRKAQEFKADAHQPPMYFNITKKTQKKLLKSTSSTDNRYHSYNYPISKIYNPYQNGRPTYNCDEGYMGQLKNYQEAYYNPSRENKIQYTNRFQEGIRYHDQHFDKFYKYLHDRDQNEQLFNKFGKRYAFDENMKQVREVIIGISSPLKQKSTHNQSQNDHMKSNSDTVRFGYNKPDANKTYNSNNDNLRTYANANYRSQTANQQLHEENFDDF